jgi:hypothetical protein
MPPFSLFSPLDVWQFHSTGSQSVFSINFFFLPLHLHLLLVFLAFLTSPPLNTSSSSSSRHHTDVSSAFSSHVCLTNSPPSAVYPTAKGSDEESVSPFHQGRNLESLTRIRFHPPRIGQISKVTKMTISIFLWVSRSGTRKKDLLNQ